MDSPARTARASSGTASASPLGLPALVCASHREPFARRKSGANVQLERAGGGLVTALDAMLRELGGRWIAAGEGLEGEAPADEEGRSYGTETLALTPRELEGYHEGFSNRVLWPLFHYFVGRVNFDSAEWQEYERVNARFADAVTRALGGEGPAVAWIHDFHLLLAPRMIREKRADATIGFFLHVPFPAFEVFRILPCRREVLEGMLGADLVGFQTQSYLEAFVESCRRLLGARIDRTGAIDHRGHRTRTMVAPLGIDVARQHELATDPRTAAKALRLRRGIPGEKLVLGVDRLEYAKGILERLAGFERLLERHPEHRGQVTLLQLALPSRVRADEHKALKREVDEAVERIEGKFGEGGWSPVRHVTRALQPDELAAWYRAADVCLVTPLRDGLNVVAKEYVASRPDLGGALVLSEFAGSAEELPQAYIVNPTGPDSIAEGLQQALTDDRVERERRMDALRSRVEANDVHRWARTFLSHLVRER